jgi:hypothetical protein
MYSHLNRGRDLDGFDLRTEARAIATKASIRSQEDLRVLAEAWASRTATLLDQFAIHHMQYWKNDPQTHGDVTDAVFVSQDAAGHPMVATAQVFNNPSAISAPFTHSEVQT